MSKWFEWGFYATVLAETGGTYPSKKISWERVESDFLINVWPSGFGGGLGIIQTTSRNHELLVAIKNDGYDFSSMPNGTIKNDIINEVKTISWFKHSGNGGLFTKDETIFIQNALKSPQGIKQQNIFNEEYIFVTNKYAYDAINQSNLSDVIKAFMINMVVLMPARVRTIVNANPKTLNEAKSLALNNTGWSNHYINRMDSIINTLTGRDLNEKPPIDFYDLIEGESDTENSPRPPVVENGTGGQNVPDNQDGINQTVPTTAKSYTIKSGDFVLYPNMLIQNKGNLKMMRYGNHLVLADVKNNPEKEKDVIDEKEKEEQKETNTEPSETLPDDKNNMIEELITETLKIPLNTLRYANVRPQPDPSIVGYADCSSFLAWGARKLFPSIWNNGYNNTGTIYRYALNNNKVIFDGAFSDLQNQTVKRGDWIEFSDAIDKFGAGNDKHIIMYLGNNECVDMNGNGNMVQNYTNLINSWYYTTYFVYANIIRLIQ